MTSRFEFGRTKSVKSLVEVEDSPGKRRAADQSQICYPNQRLFTSHSHQESQGKLKQPHLEASLTAPKPPGSHKSTDASHL